MKRYFKAPWGLKLKLLTGGFGLLLLFGALLVGSFGALGLLAIAAVAASDYVRGYRIDDGQLTVHRLFWATHFDLSRVVEVAVYPGGLEGSRSALGLGELFGFVGWCWHPKLGWYESYATDDTKAVILDFGDKRVFATPESLADFAEVARRHAKSGRQFTGV